MLATRFKAFLNITIITEYDASKYVYCQAEFPQTCDMHVFQLVNPLSFKNKRNKENHGSRKKD